MRCKWDILNSVNPSLISMADVFGACHCDRCKRERKKDKEIKRLKKKCKE